MLYIKNTKPVSLYTNILKPNRKTDQKSETIIFHKTRDRPEIDPSREHPYYKLVM